jgi:hypothetical protein
MVGMGGKPLDSTLTVDAAIHDAVMALRRTNGVTAQTSMRRCVMVSNLARWVLPELRTIRRSEGDGSHALSRRGLRWESLSQ